MVNRDDVDANRDKAESYGLTFPIALQRKWEISREYGMFATPIGYPVDQEGDWQWMWLWEVTLFSVPLGTESGSTRRRGGPVISRD